MCQKYDPKTRQIALASKGSLVFYLPRRGVVLMFAKYLYVPVWSIAMRLVDGRNVSET